MIPFKIYRNQTLYTDYEAAKSAIIASIESGHLGDGVIAVATYGESWEGGMSLIAVTHNGSYTLMDFNELIRQLESDERVTASALNDLDKRLREAISDVPDDGKIYGRSFGSWVEIETNVFLEATTEEEFDPTENKNSLLRTPNDVEAPFMKDKTEDFDHIFNNALTTGNHNADFVAAEVNTDFGDTLCEMSAESVLTSYNTNYEDFTHSWWKMPNQLVVTFDTDITRNLSSITVKASAFFSIHGVTGKIAGNYPNIDFSLEQTNGDSTSVTLHGYTDGADLTTIDISEVTIDWDSSVGNELTISATGDENPRANLFELILNFSDGEHVYVWEKLAKKDVVMPALESLDTRATTVETSISALTPRVSSAETRLTTCETKLLSLGDIPVYKVNNRLPRAEEKWINSIWKDGEKLYTVKASGGVTKAYSLMGITGTSEVTIENYDSLASAITNGWKNDFVLEDISKTFRNGDPAGIKFGNSSTPGYIDLMIATDDESGEQKYPNISSVIVYVKNWSGRTSNFNICGSNYIFSDGETHEVKVTELDTNVLEFATIKDNSDSRGFLTNEIIVTFGQPTLEWVEISGSGSDVLDILKEDEKIIARALNNVDSRLIEADEKHNDLITEINNSEKAIARALTDLNKRIQASDTKISEVEGDMSSLSERLATDEATLDQATQDIIDANERIDNVIENHDSLVSELLDDEEIISRSLNNLHARTTDLSSQIDEKADESDVNELRNSKQDTLISGNGISLNNNVVSLTKNTVVLSQSEYDAIPDSEKNTNNVIYFITEES